MSGTIALGFPVLDEDGSSFADGVSYTVSAEIRGAPPSRTLSVTHRLTGRSFVRDWVEAEDAQFSTLLVFRSAARREAHPHDGTLAQAGEALVATQRLPMPFLETPEVTCSIVATRGRQLIVSHPASGLTDFWPAGETIDIPRYARIGRHAKLTFEDGSLGGLIRVIEKKELKSGQMETKVEPQAQEGTKPVTLSCATDVYDELQAFNETLPSRSREAMRSAIVTQALCAIYAHMHMLFVNEQGDDDENNINSALRSHGERVENETGTIWGNENFDPSLAATQMRPYTILKTDDANDED